MASTEGSTIKTWRTSVGGVTAAQHTKGSQAGCTASSFSFLSGPRWREDVLGPLPCMDRGNRYVLMAMDYFTKWLEAYSLLKQEAETIANALLEGMFSRSGASESIHSDRAGTLNPRWLLLCVLVDSASWACTKPALLHCIPSAYILDTKVTINLTREEWEAIHSGNLCESVVPSSAFGRRNE